MSSGSHLSRELYDLIKSIGETRSKEEEDRIIQAEVIDLKPEIARKNITPKRMKELLIKALYIEMLGQSAEFTHIHAVNLTQNKILTLKRIGYLLCTLFFNQNSDLLIMMISTMQKDLGSTNIHEIVICLTALTKLMNSTIAAAVTEPVLKLLSHNTDLVRKKALLVIQRIQNICPGHISEFQSKMKRGLHDREPSVMAAALNIYYDQVKNEPEKYKEYASSFVIILKQIIQHKLPKEFDFHRAPAPWLQIKILQILGLLGRDDLKTSEHAYEILGQALRRAEDMTINIGFALMYQCVKTIANIYPQPALLQDASHCTAKFLESTSPNLKYMGLRLLSELFKTYPKILEGHYFTVIQCLESKDETLKKETLELLYKITNQSNIQVVSKKMIAALCSSTDHFFRQNLVTKMSELAERFAPSHQWYVDTMHVIFEFGSQHISNEVLNNFLKLLMDNYNENKQHFGPLVIESNLELLTRVQPTDIMVKMVSWVFGEIGSNIYNNEGEKLQEITEVLIKMLTLDFEDKSTSVWVINALGKISSCKGFPMHSEVKATLEEFSTVVTPDVYQRSMEYRKLAKYNAALRISSVLKFDETMAFLKPYVDNARRQGAREYQPNFVTSASTAPDLKFTPYVTGFNNNAATATLNDDGTLKLDGASGLWGAGGYAGQIKRDDPKSKISLTNISNMKTGFGSESLGIKDIPVADAPVYRKQEKPVPVNPNSQKLVNDLFKSVGAGSAPVAAKFKGPQPVANKPVPVPNKPTPVPVPATTQVQSKPTLMPQGPKPNPVPNKPTPNPNPGTQKPKQPQTVDLLEL